MRDIAAGSPFPLRFFPELYSRGVLFANLGDLRCLSWDDGIHGAEPWCTDGTAAGTYLLKDICAGECGPQMFYGAVLDGTLYFDADDGVHGRELWKTDGTTAGTRLVADLVPGFRYSAPAELTAVAGAVVFSAITPGTGRELWRTDGTAAGTVLLADLVPGPESSQPQGFVAHDGKAFFEANTPTPCGDKVCGSDLWVTDGTREGTLPLGVYPEGAQLGIPWASLGPLLFFQGYDGADWHPWVTDGTPSGTHRIDPDRSITAVAGFRRMGDAIYFGGWQGGLWRTDGTAEGTSQVSEIYAGFPRGTASGLTALDHCLLFFADHPDYGRELWVSDGTTAGTALLKDIQPGPGSGFSIELLLRGGSLLTSTGDEAFFWADDGIHGGELWRSDCTPEGTVLVGDLVPGPGTSFGLPPVPAAQGDGIVFGAVDANGHADLWRATGTPGSAELVRHIDAFVSSRPEELASTPQGLFFGAAIDAQGPRLFLSDSGTREVQTAGGEPILGPARIAAAGDTVYLNSWVSRRGNQLWRVRGGVATLVADGVAAAGQFVPVGTSVAFATYDGLRRIDETTGILSVLSDESVDIVEPPATRSAIAYFPSYDALWRTDGTAAGTFPLAPELGLGNVESLTRLGNDIYFLARDATHGRELWRLDAEEAVELVADLAPGPADGVTGRYDLQSYGFVLSRYPPANAALVAAGGSLYFNGNDGVHGWEPWRSDGTSAGTAMVADLAPGAASSEPAHLAATCGRLYFAADHPTLGRTLWKSDGTAAGTFPATAAPPAHRPTLPDELTPWGERLFFTAHTPAAGRELWMTLNGRTRRVADIAPGPLPSTPNWLTVHDGRLYFAANDGSTGFELWALDAPYLPCGGEQIFADGFESGTTEAWSAP